MFCYTNTEAHFGGLYRMVWDLTVVCGVCVCVCVCVCVRESE